MANYSQLVGDLRNVYRSGRTQNVEWRKQQLSNLLRLLDTEKDAICTALKKDLNKCKVEAALYEVSLTRNDVVTALDNVENWVQPQKVSKALLNIADEVYVRNEPLGVVLIIGAWNYPIQLVLLPLLGAIAAGNAVVVKPSEVCEATAKLLETILPKYLDPDAIKVVNGAVAETTALLKERFDHIFYTGNSAVGKIVMEAASKYLTPVTLELGGKSPVYVDKSSDMEVVARRIAWGKFANAGQTCIAPDYIMCTKAVQDQLVEKFRAVIKEYYGEDPQKSPDYGRIVNNRHFHRVKALIAPDKVVIGGQTDEKDKYIAPTVLANVTFNDNPMKEEVFGPLLPIVPVENVDRAIEFINGREKPLALYVFSKNDQVTDKLIANCTSGGLCVNDVLMHAGVDTLPFGGVGNSGMGFYHGKFSFECFSHKRGCLIKKQAMEGANKIRCPPFTDKKLDWMMWLTKKSPKKGGISGFLPIVVLGMIFAFLFKLLGLQNYLPKGLTQ